MHDDQFMSHSLLYWIYIILLAISSSLLAAFALHAGLAGGLYPCGFFTSRFQTFFQFPAQHVLLVSTCCTVPEAQSDAC